MVRMDARFTAADSLSPDIAARLAQHAARYKSQLSLECGDKNIQLGSLIGILSMELYRGTRMIVIADGEDEELAAEDIRLVLSGD